jgi:hypothetical protein
MKSRRIIESTVRHAAARAIVLPLLAVVGSACTYVEHVHVHSSASSPSKDKVASAKPAPEPRFPSEDPLDAVVRIASVNGECSATVVGDRLVITAKTCFDRITSPKSFFKDRVRARIGGGAVAWHIVPVMAVLSAPCTSIAVMVTDAPIPDATPMRMRLGGEVAVGEPVRVIGFGRCSGASPGTRTVGFVGHVREIDDQTFRADAPACVGDAGGPIVSEWTGEVVGVLQGDPVLNDGTPVSGGGGFAGRVDVARGVLAQAFLVAHGVEPGQLPPIACQ